MSAQTVAPGDWPHFNRDAGSSRYVPLNEINTTNVSSLQPAWTYQPVAPPAATPDGGRGAAPAAPAAGGRAAGAGAPAGGGRAAGAGAPAAGGRGAGGAGAAAGGRGGGRGAGRGGGGAPSVGAQAVPVVVNGTMYVPAGAIVVAIDGATGKETWRYTLTSGAASARGVNYWAGTATVKPRIVFMAGRNLVAVDAATGQPAAGFGTNGVVDTGVSWNGVPVVFRNVLVLGASTLETEVDPNAPGDTRAFDAISGKQKWVFHSVPRPGEVGHDTWLNDGWKDRSGTNVWSAHMTVDEQLGLVYIPLGGPASNYYGGDRPGANLFGNSIVAVDGETGKYRWHFQLVHHDIWDFDNPPAPVLLDIQRDGRRVPAIAQIGKSGWMFILNRATGEPIFGVDERPVAKGDVPGEWYSPTQPFPRKPRELARMSFSYADLVTAEDTNPTHAANCRALVEKSGGFYNAGPFTPFLYHEDGTPPRSSIIFPGATGGTNWGGMATDQQRGLVFVYTQNQGQMGWVEKKKPGVSYAFDEAQSKLEYTRASVNGPGPFFTFSAPAGEGLGNLPCQRPPWGQLNAVDANTGDVLWQVPVGTVAGLPAGKQNTGLAGGFAGPTATAGGLVFYGGLSDRKLRAFDSQTGKELWSTDLGGTATMQPMSYRGSDGRQYVAVVTGGAVKTFALPR
jgi:quinoprotein glucose dehydrogenase